MLQGFLDVIEDVWNLVVIEFMHKVKALKNVFLKNV